MISINKQDFVKTALILWFVATTCYVAYDQYLEFKVRGMQASYQQGISDSITQLIEQTEKSQCQPFDVRKDSTTIQLVDAKCLK